MRAILSSFGSTGDVEPFAALAQELQRHGHSVTLASLPQFRDRAGALGIDFAATGPATLLDALQTVLRIETADAATLESFRAEFPFGDVMQLVSDLRALCDDADVLIGQGQFPLGFMVHELTGIPFVSVHLDYNNYFETSGADPISSFEREVQPLFNYLREALGLRPMERPLTTGSNSDQLALFAVSRLLLDPAREPDWPDHHHVTGFFFVEQPDWTPDRALVEFLDAGDPPIVITFGSMVHDDPEEMTQNIIAAIEAVGCRALVHRGWSGLADDEALPGSVHVMGFVPYGWLFPRVACVVQSGGAGTMALTMRTGTPAVCVPHIGWQFSFARFARDQGFAGPIVPVGELTSERLATAIADTMEHQSYRNAAQYCRDVVGSEGGTATARTLIEDFVNTA